MAIAVLIAVATVIGAVVGWRISVASGAAAAADSRGLEAALHAANTGTSVSTYLSTNLSFFAEYVEHLGRALLLERDLAQEADAARRKAMQDEALRERNLASVARGYVNADYIKLDPETGQESFDGDRFWDAQWAEAAVSQDLDPAPAFSQADRARAKARALTAVAFALSLALFLLTGATVAKPRWTRGLAAGAIPIVVAAIAAVGCLEWLL